MSYLGASVDEDQELCQDSIPYEVLLEENWTGITNANKEIDGDLSAGAAYNGEAQARACPPVHATASDRNSTEDEWLSRMEILILEIFQGKQRCKV